MTFAYTVHAAFDDPAVATEWADWLRNGHFADVLAAGAGSAELVQRAPLELEARYWFADAAAFARYEQESAPKLRAEGLTKFPPSRGVRLSRTMGGVLFRLPLR